DIQTLRHLNEQEVKEINFIIKSRAHRYVAAARPEWLYPEADVTKSDWYDYGDGYLFMPDPRSVSYSREIIMGRGDGTATAYDEYGRRPWQEGFSGQQKGTDRDWDTFNRFKGEFAHKYGPVRRGRACNLDQIDNERDSDEIHRYHLGLYSKHKTG